MGIFSGLLDEQRAAMTEQRSSLENPQTSLAYPAEWLMDLFNGGRTDSGARVSELTALQCSTFLACVDLISGSVSSLDWHVKERSLNDHERAIETISYGHPLYDLVSLEPNEEMSAAVFLKVFMVHALVWTNAYAEIQRDAGNRAIAFWPRNPYRTRPFRLASAVRLDPAPWRPFPVVLPAGKLVFKTTDGIDSVDYSEVGASDGVERIIPAEDMLHLPGLSLDGRIGENIVRLARQTLGLALTAEKFGSKYFANFAKPGGLLELPIAPGQNQEREKARQSWMEAQGGENSHRVAVMPAGTKFTPLSHNPQDAQAIETRQHIRTEIAALMHVPPHMVGIGDRGKSTTEQSSQEFIQYTLRHWIKPLKLEFKRKLLPHSGIGRKPRNSFFIDCDISPLIRPDAASREKFNASGRQWGYLSANDVRANEGLNPINEPWAEEYWMPANQTLSTTPINPNHQDGAGNGDKPKEEPVAA